METGERDAGDHKLFMVCVCGEGGGRVAGDHALFDRCCHGMMHVCQEGWGQEENRSGHSRPEERIDISLYV